MAEDITDKKNERSINQYTQAQREWDDRFAFHARQARIATGFAAIFASVSLCLGGVIIWQAMHRTYIPYVVMVDDLGRPALANPPQLVTDWPEAVVLREVADFVTRLRAIPADEFVLRKSWKDMLLFTRKGNAGYQKIYTRGQSKVASPFVLKDQITVEVEVSSVLYQTGSTWLAEWTETTRDKAGGAIAQIKTYRGSFTLSKLSSASPEALTVNPLGILVEDFDIQLLGGA